MSGSSDLHCAAAAGGGVVAAGGVENEDAVGGSIRPLHTYTCIHTDSPLVHMHRIAPEFLHGTKLDAEFDTDEVPLIVFINARSGGRVGPELAAVLARAVGSSQVCHES